MLTDSSPYALEYIHNTDVSGPKGWLFGEGCRDNKPFNMLPEDVVDYFAQQSTESTTVQTNEIVDEEGGFNSAQPLG